MKIKLENIKEGYVFRKDRYERIIEVGSIGKGFVVFRTSSENKDGLIISEYCGQKIGEFLNHIFTTGREAVQHYKWGENCPLPREQLRR